MVDAIVNLLREAEEVTRPVGDAVLQTLLESEPSSHHERDPVNSRYGIMLLKELCRPQPALSVVSGVHVPSLW